MNEDIIINEKAIEPSICSLETQIILQRHCNYDKKTGLLVEESKEEEKAIINDFLESLTYSMMMIYIVF